jgi:tRNA-specific 2-thiouridylase
VFAKPKVLVAMSGGVDSSVAAALLKRDGHDVVGCFMRLGSPGETLDELIPESCPPQHSAFRPPSFVKIGHQGCCSITDAADARLVAAELDIPFYVCNFKKDFGRIIDYFVDEYARGRTPNPCVRCNDWLKFGKLHEYARQIGADFVASGHYARVEDGRLLRGRDHSKDQSYVLFGVPRDRLSEMLLPIGGMLKPEVRDLAKRFSLPVFNKPDSQEICFVPDNDYAGLVERRRPNLAAAGKVLDPSGAVVGEHSGQHHYTIGQRRGVGVALGYPIYVTGKDPATNTIRVGPREDLTTTECTVGEANWLVEDSLIRDGMACLAQYRYNSEPVAARITRLPDAADDTPSSRRGRFQVEFDEPQFAVAPGQALVVYDTGDSDTVMGGGWIESA